MRTTLTRRPAATAVAWLLALLLGLLVGACDVGVGEDAGSASIGQPAAETYGIATVPPDAWRGGTIALGELPPEAHETLARIEGGGPHPYRQDGGTFQNREGLLPDQPVGFYAEFTVDTPGSPDRGARRLVVGDDDGTFYTEDHYASFRFVIP